jgi:hypothetical protein
MPSPILPAFVLTVSTLIALVAQSPLGRRGSVRALPALLQVSVACSVLH